VLHISLTRSFRASSAAVPLTTVVLVAKRAEGALSHSSRWHGSAKWPDFLQWGPVCHKQTNKQTSFEVFLGYGSRPRPQFSWAHPWRRVEREADEPFSTKRVVGRLWGSPTTGELSATPSSRQKTLETRAKRGRRVTKGCLSGGRKRQPFGLSRPERTGEPSRRRDSLLSGLS
jgi:hypothetical protein